MERSVLPNRIARSLSLYAALFILSNPAGAAFVLTLDDPLTSGVDIVLSDDLLPGSFTDSGLLVSHTDVAGGAGVISFSGAVGAFTVNVTTGISDPLIGPARLDLNSIDVSGAAGRLNVSLTDTDFSDSFSGFTVSHGGTTDANVSFDYLYDSGNGEFSGAVFASDAFNANGSERGFSFNYADAIVPDSSYSLSILASIEHTGAGQVTSFDATMSPVPVPMSAVLFLSGLFTLHRMRR